MTTDQLTQLAEAAGVTDAAALAWLLGNGASPRSAAKLDEAHRALYVGCCTCPQCRGREKPHHGGRTATTQLVVLRSLLAGPARPSDIYRDLNLTADGCHQCLRKLRAAGVVGIVDKLWQIVDMDSAWRIIRRAEERMAA